MRKLGAQVDVVPVAVRLICAREQLALAELKRDRIEEQREAHWETSASDFDDKGFMALCNAWNAADLEVKFREAEVAYLMARDEGNQTALAARQEQMESAGDKFVAFVLRESVPCEDLNQLAEPAIDYDCVVEQFGAAVSEEEAEKLQSARDKLMGPLRETCGKVDLLSGFVQSEGVIMAVFVDIMGRFLVRQLSLGPKGTFVIGW
jgi:hypothetical protein